MNSPNPAPLSEKRLELVNWFRTNAESLSGAYEGAIRLLDDASFPGRVHFIAHAMRDIADRLAFALEPQLDPSRVQYEQTMDAIMEHWPNIHAVDIAEGEEKDQDSVRIEFKLASRINALVDAHRARRQGPSNYDLLFQILMRRGTGRASANQRLVSDFKKMREWFMDRTHLPSMSSHTVDEQELRTEFNKFEGMLHSFVGDFFTGTAELDEILRKAND